MLVSPRDLPHRIISLLERMSMPMYCVPNGIKLNRPLRVSCSCSHIMPQQPRSVDTSYAEVGETKNHVVRGFTQVGQLLEG